VVLTQSTDPVAALRRCVRRDRIKMDDSVAYASGLWCEYANPLAVRKARTDFSS
jgi:hypothetical protein